MVVGCFVLCMVVVLDVVDGTTLRVEDGEVELCVKVVLWVNDKVVVVVNESTVCVVLVITSVLLLLETPVVTGCGSVIYDVGILVKEIVVSNEGVV